MNEDLRARMELAKRGEIAAGAATRSGGDAFGHFALDDDVDIANAVTETLEQVMENWRRNVVGKIAIDAEIAAFDAGGVQCGEIE